MNAALTICIPTFNRVEYLRACLEAFLPQVAPHQIPICVSDNGSTDGTVAMLEQFQRERYPLLSFRAATENRGIDQNMADVVNMACTKHAWLFGDDDLPEPQAVEVVLRCIAQGYTLVVVNAATYNADLSQMVESRRVMIADDQIYEPGDHNRLMVDTASYITYLGGVVVSLEAWRSIDATPFLRTDYLHVSVVFRAIVGKRAMLCATPLIKLRLQPPSWLSRSFEVEMVNWPRTVWSLPAEHYSTASKQAVVGEHPTAQLHRIVAMRGYGHFTARAYAAYVATDSQIGSVKKALFWVIARLPEALFRHALVALMRVKRWWQPQRYELALFRLREASRWPKGAR